MIPRLRALAALVLGAGAAAAPPAALPDPQTPIPTGTQGVVRTILTGDRIQEIPLRFLGLYRGAAGPVDSRTMSAVCRSWWGCWSSPRMSETTRSPATRPFACMGWRTVVSRGRTHAASG